MTCGFSQEHSDSNSHRRDGCPHEELDRGDFEWLHLLTHPAIWVYEGRSMRETMLSMLERERVRRIDQLENARWLEERRAEIEAWL